MKEAEAWTACFFFFNDTATTEIYTLSLHDALPISGRVGHLERARRDDVGVLAADGDRKSTRLNSSHANISYAVFCSKKKKTTPTSNTARHPQARTTQACAEAHNT